MMNWNEALNLVAKDDVGKWDEYALARTMGIDPATGNLVFKTAEPINGPIGVEHRLAMTELALGQLCGRLEIPARYARRIPSELFSRCAEYDLRRLDPDAKFFIRCKGEVVRAALSGMYAPLSNSFITNAIAELTNGVNHSIKSFYLGERGMWAKILLHDLTREDPSKPGDPLKVGLLVGNSEVGSRAVTIWPFVFRAVCTNDLVVQTDEALTARHIYLTESELKVRAATAINNAVRAGTEVMDRFAATYKERVESPAEVIAKLAEKRRFSQELADAVVVAFQAEPHQSRWGVANAFTRAAQAMDEDERIALESFAGSYLFDHRRLAA